MNLEEQPKNNKKQSNKPVEMEEEGEDMEEFEEENWNNPPLGVNNNQDWEKDWDNKPRSDEFFNQFKAFLLKK